MATLLLCNRISGNGKRVRIDGVNLKGPVKVLRNNISAVLGIPEERIDLIYSGRILRDAQELEHYDIKPGVTVHAMKSPPPVEEARPEPLSEEGVKQVVTALQSALMKSAYRATLEKILNDKESLENIIAATPGLDRDPVAVAILQEPELLVVATDSTNVRSVIEAHPALGQAVLLVAAEVNEKGASGASRGGGSRATYSLDQMSDDEDLDGVRMNPQAGQAITASQLAAALMAAGSMQPGPSGAGGSSSDSSSSGSRAGGISADFFQQAMQQASTQTSEEHIQSQLAQLRDMGITDEAVARQALQATGGDLQAALEMLFGDGMQ